MANKVHTRKFSQAIAEVCSRAIIKGMSSIRLDEKAEICISC